MWFAAHLINLGGVPPDRKIALGHMVYPLLHSASERTQDPLL